MQRSFLTLVLFAFVLATPSWPAEPPPATMKELLSRFTQSNWVEIRRAKWELESRQKEAIPELIALLDRHEVVDLTGDGGLGYPGGVFFGHGEILPYDLDYLPARAGWALEELTFEDFGFQGSAKKKSVPIQVYPVPEGGIPKPEPPTWEERREKFGPPIARVKEWWRTHRAGWSRLAALKEALRSPDLERQSRGVTWLRQGTTRCDGLSPEVYTRELKPLVEKLVSSPDTNAKLQAELLLKEGDSWWRAKTSPDPMFEPDLFPEPEPAPSPP